MVATVLALRLPHIQGTLIQKEGGWWAGADSNCHILSEAILQTVRLTNAQPTHDARAANTGGNRRAKW